MKTIITIGGNVNGYILPIIFLFLCSFTTSAQVGIGTTTPLSTFEVNGSVGQKVTVVTTNTTLNDTYSLVICNNGSTSITITLPDASTIIGRIYTIKRDASATASVSIATTSTQNIDGISTYTLANAKDAVTVVSDGVNWQITNKF